MSVPNVNENSLSHNDTPFRSRMQSQTDNVAESDASPSLNNTLVGSSQNRSSTAIQSGLINLDASEVNPSLNLTLEHEVTVVLGKHEIITIIGEKISQLVSSIKGTPGLSKTASIRTQIETELEAKLEQLPIASKEDQDILSVIEQAGYISADTLDTDIAKAIDNSSTLERLATILEVETAGIILAIKTMVQREDVFSHQLADSSSQLENMRQQLELAEDNLKYSEAECSRLASELQAAKDQIKAVNKGTTQATTEVTIRGNNDNHGSNRNAFDNNGVMIGGSLRNERMDRVGHNRSMTSLYQSRIPHQRWPCRPERGIEMHQQREIIPIPRVLTQSNHRAPDLSASNFSLGDSASTTSAASKAQQKITETLLAGLSGLQGMNSPEIRKFTGEDHGYTFRDFLRNFELRHDPDSTKDRRRCLLFRSYIDGHAAAAYESLNDHIKDGLFKDLVVAMKSKLIEYTSASAQRACTELANLTFSKGTKLVALFTTIDRLAKKVFPDLAESQLSVYKSDHLLRCLSHWQDHNLLVREHQNAKDGEGYERIKTMAVSLDSTHKMQQKNIPPLAVPSTDYQGASQNKQHTGSNVNAVSLSGQHRYRKHPKEYPHNPDYKLPSKGNHNVEATTKVSTQRNNGNRALQKETVTTNGTHSDDEPDNSWLYINAITCSNLPVDTRQTKKRRRRRRKRTPAIIDSTSTDVPKCRSISCVESNRHYQVEHLSNPQRFCKVKAPVASFSAMDTDISYICDKPAIGNEKTTTSSAFFAIGFPRNSHGFGPFVPRHRYTVATDLGLVVEPTAVPPKPLPYRADTTSRLPSRATDSRTRLPSHSHRHDDATTISRLKTL